MPITLPRQKTEPSSLSPDVLILYGVPKVGKTEKLSELQDCLILDGEDGTKRYANLSLSTKTYSQMQDVLLALNEEFKANGSKPVYDKIAVDTVEQLEEIAIHKAAEFYKETPMGKPWYAKNYKSPGVLQPTGERITMLPNGAGWGYIREALKWYVSVLKTFCKHLILVAHVKDKKVMSLDGIEEVIVKDIDLMGKNGGILAAASDAIGYMYRTAKGELMVSFQTGENSVMGSRCKHIAGQKIPFDWAKIYID